MKIKRIGNIILEVKDLDVSIKFYHEIFNYMPVQVPIVNKQFEFTTLIRSQADYSAAADG